MSGGRFLYKQYEIDAIAEEVRKEIEENEYEFCESTLAKFKEGYICLKKAALYAQRIDWLLSGDDDEEAFAERLAEQLEELERAEIEL